MRVSGNRRERPRSPSPTPSRPSWYRRRRDSQKSVASRRVNDSSSSKTVDATPLSNPYPSYPLSNDNGYGPYEYDPARPRSPSGIRGYPISIPATIIRRPRSYYSDDSPFTDIYATYIVPGKVSVPNGGNNLNVTITRLELDTKLSRITIPKKDARVHLQASGFISPSEYGHTDAL